MSDAGKIQLGNKPVNIKLLAEKLITQFSGPVEAKGLGFTSHIHPDLDIELMIDETIVCQLVSNLLSIAVKFTANGSINLTINKLMASGTTVTVQFIVKDTGIGIPADKQKEIVESFGEAHIETSWKH